MLNVQFIFGADTDSETTGIVKENLEATSAKIPHGQRSTASELRACLSAPWKGAELQWESKPTRQLSLQPVAAETGMEAMKCPKLLVQKARQAGQRASRP
jgi:hypothetical protein